MIINKVTKVNALARKYHNINANIIQNSIRAECYLTDHIQKYETDSQYKSFTDLIICYHADI